MTYRWPEAIAHTGTPKPMTPLRVFVGFDERETVAYHVLCHSLLTHASIPLAITPLRSATLPMFLRPWSATQATDFSFTRFLVPWLSRYEGLSVFMDCDMLVQADIAELLRHADEQPTADVLCCQHDYTPTETIKFLGNEQKAYPRKNWSSLMVFRNAQCRTLTPDYVNTASAADLHRLAWAREVGSLPLGWNWLVGEYPPNPAAQNLHWTIGGPWFPDYAQVDHADRWRDAHAAMQRAG